MVVGDGGDEDGGRQWPSRPVRRDEDGAKLWGALLFGFIGAAITTLAVSSIASEFISDFLFFFLNAKFGESSHIFLQS